MPVRMIHVALGSVCLLFWTARAEGQLDIDVQITPGGGLFHYDYRLTNTTLEDIVIVTIEVPADPLVISNLVAPAGYLANFDPGLGLLDFIEGTEWFAPGVEVGGFAFDSPLGPGNTNFTALSALGTLISGVTTAPVPEPAAIFLLGPALADLLCRRGSRPADRRKRHGPRVFHPDVNPFAAAHSEETEPCSLAS